MMRTYEWIVVSYFVYLAASALGAGRQRIVGPALTVALVPLGLASLGDARWTSIVRDWAPNVYLLAGYWLPARFVVSCDERFEQRLLALDRRWLGVRAVAWVDRGPRPLVELLEAAYLACYPLVPAGFAWLSFAGLRGHA